MNRFIKIGLWLWVALLPAGPAVARQLVIYDNDWNVSRGSAGYVAQPALAILMANPDVRILGLTGVSGDAWRDEGLASLLRYLEWIGARHIPVHAGAEHPLVNSAQRHAAWEARFGKIAWAGAWNDRTRDALAHPDDPHAIVPPREGLPQGRRARMDAVSFMIAAVHRHPGRVTIFAEGPLTNLALALRRDPAFARLVGRIVVQGSAIAGVPEGTGKPAEFNFLFDPEAARIVLAARWRHPLVLVGAVADSLVMDDALRTRIAAIGTPAAAYATANATPELPLWSQVGVAVAVDRHVVRASVPAVVAVSTRHDASYGRTRAWRPDDPARPAGLRPLVVVTAIDRQAIVARYLAGLRHRP